MKAIQILTVALVAISTMAFASVEDHPKTLVSIALADGSTLKAEFVNETVNGQTAFLDSLALKCDTIKTITFTDTNGLSKVELSNGDKFRMRIADNVFDIKSSLGELRVSRSGIRSLSFSTAKASTAAVNGLIYSCSFDSTEGIASPEFGPAGKMELAELHPTGGRNGGALFVKPGLAGAQIPFPANSFGSNGCIEFWAKFQSGKTEFSTGGDPRFFLLTTTDGTELCHFEYASNDGCGHSGLTARLEGIRVYSHNGFQGLMPYSDIFRGEDFNGWHHYALSWTTDAAVIYLDGKELCRGNGHVDATDLSKELILDIPLNRRRGKSYNNKSAFLMDDLKIWNFAKSEFDIE